MLDKMRYFAIFWFVLVVSCASSKLSSEHQYSAFLKFVQKEGLFRKNTSMHSRWGNLNPMLHQYISKLNKDQQLDAYIHLESNYSVAELDGEEAFNFIMLFDKFPDKRLLEDGVIKRKKENVASHPVGGINVE